MGDPSLWQSMTHYDREGRGGMANYDWQGGQKDLNMIAKFKQKPHKKGWEIRQFGIYKLSLFQPLQAIYHCLYPYDIVSGN